MPARSLGPAALRELSGRIETARAEHDQRRVVAPTARQPVHTLYVPADDYTARTVAEYGEQARRLLDRHAAGTRFAAIFSFEEELSAQVRERVAAKLTGEPVEDVRIDFEDGYGARSDDEEDRHAAAAATQIVQQARAGDLTRRWGARVKSFADGAHERSLRTLDLFLTGVLEECGALPEGVVVTFPKVVSVAHVALFAEALGRLERACGLADGALRFEVQIEMTESVLDRHGVVAPRLVEASAGRLSGAHIGVFDYTAALDLPPAEQRLDHPALDFARHVLQVGLAGTGVELCDGSTNLSPDAEDADAVRAAWRQHAAHVRHSLRHGFRQGWDLHPAHLVSRYAAVYGHYLDGLDGLLGRLRAWQRSVTQDQAAMQTDEPATARALLAHLGRAVAVGAVPRAQVADVLDEAIK